MSKIE
jgi:hypothetical protein